MNQKSSRGPSAPGGIHDKQGAGRIHRRRRLRQRKEQLEAQIALIEAQDKEIQRKRETRANIIIGAVVRSHAALHPAFVHALADILHAGVRRPGDRELLASILGLPQLTGADGACDRTRTNDAVKLDEARTSISQPRNLRLYARAIMARRGDV